MNKTSFYFLCILCVFFFGCAQIIPIDGGDKDTTAPSVKYTTPINQSIHFSSNKIILHFNEFITLASNPKKNIIISPPLQNYNYKIVGKKLVLNIKDTLKSNTTYSISFESAIKDITEGNLLETYHYLFSTGSKIDTHLYKGLAIQSFTKDPASNYKAMLYESSASDSVPFKSIPLYVSKTNKNGAFVFKTLKPGTYKLVIFKDDNTSLKIETLNNESIGFSEKPIIIPSKKDCSIIQVFTPKKTHIYATVKEQNNLLNRVINLHGPFVKEKLFFKPKQNITYIEYNNKTYTLWFNTNQLKDSNTLYIYHNELLIDSFIHLFQKDVPKKQSEKDSIFNFSTNLSNKLISPNKYLKIRSKEPFKLNNPSGIELYGDSQRLKINLNTFNNWQTELTIPYAFLNASYEQYRFVIKPHAIINIHGVSVDTNTTYTFSTIPKSAYGEFLVTIIGNPKVNYIFELLSKNKKQVLLKKAFIHQIELKTGLLNPGKYFFKVTEDLNNDNEWTTGDYFKHIQPEYTYLYKKPLELIDNFEKSITWFLSDSTSN